MSIKDQKTEELIKHLAADFLHKESSGLSLITVTNVIIENRGQQATILVSVFPEDKQDDALDFAKRKRTEFREYLKNNAKIGKIPRVDFAIDLGEKNRQRIEEISAT